MCIYFSSYGTAGRFKRAWPDSCSLSASKQRDWGEEGPLKGTVTLKVSSLRRLERKRGKSHTMPTATWQVA